MTNAQTRVFFKLIAAERRYWMDGHNNADLRFIKVKHHDILTVEGLSTRGLACAKRVENGDLYAALDAGNLNPE
jgi:hypothetical protein